MGATNDLNLEPTKSEFAIDEAVSIELKTTALENKPQSSELVDPFPIDLATLIEQIGVIRCSIDSEKVKTIFIKNTER